MAAAIALVAMVFSDAAIAVGTTSRVSVANTGAQATDSSQKSSISDNGRYIAFESWADNLVPNDTGQYIGIYVRDRTGKKTTRVDVATNGTHGNGLSSEPSISSNGRYVAFESSATNLVSGDTNATGDVFVRDRDTDADNIMDEAGAVSTERVSVSSSEAQTNFLKWSSYPSISPDGRHVAFKSDATNLVSGDTNAKEDVFVRDRQNGTTARISVSTSGAQGTGTSNSSQASISSPFIGGAKGRYVVFTSDHSNLVSGDTNAVADVFLRDRDRDNDNIMDEPGAVTTTRVSLTNAGAQSLDHSYYPSVSANGRYVAFSSNANLTGSGSAGDGADVFVRDQTTNKTIKVSVTTTGVQGNGGSSAGMISSSGRHVTFASVAPNLVGTGSTQDIIVRDRDKDKDGIMDEAGAVSTTNESLSSSGAEPNWHNYAPSITSNGRYVTFYSGASNLVSNDTNGKDDTFLRDRGVQ
jgi:Tol biopolymer transport system component